MLLPFMPLSMIAREIITFGDRVYEKGEQLSPSEQEDFNLCCQAWKERTCDAVTFKMFEIIKGIYGGNKYEKAT